MTICQVCQQENPAGAEYCEDCGAALSAPAPAPVGAGVSSGGSAAASAPGTPPSAPAVPLNAPASPSFDGVPTVPPTSSSSSAAALPKAPAANEAPEEPASPAAPSPSPSPSPSQGAAPAAPSTSSTAGAPATAKLLAIRYGAPTGDEIPLFGQRLVVGRFDPETGPVDIDLSDAAESGHISRLHGELYRDGEGSWMIRDLGSTNGVFVKSAADATFGPRITAPHPLMDGDELAFGNVRFIFKTS